MQVSIVSHIRCEICIYDKNKHSHITLVELYLKKKSYWAFNK